MSGFNMPPGVSPIDIPGNGDDAWREEGDMQAMAVMTLRDVFAAKAMLGLICEPVEGITAPLFMEMKAKTVNAIAAASYEIADAMLKARTQ